ncbi:MAG: hypothetical protein COY81_00230 [Candidatus Pacebacteria bacterium CG_4_10_14_0_8_um_filter_43_12]|nr:MAG: hypothetical protein COY81_00230 [Candidatus Pacebacteria bacterium CG_4_10_14_0_8_um_filter_43_12]
MKYFVSIISILTNPTNHRQVVRTLLRILWWKINQLYFMLPSIYQLTQTTKIICQPDSSYGSYIIYARYPEYDEMAFIHSYLRRNDIMFDVGANIGAISLLAADKITAGKVYAFEPTPSILAQLETNINLNKLGERIHTCSKAVSNSDGLLTFMIGKNSEVNHLAVKNNFDGSQAIQVPSVTVDTFLREEQIDRINLLKVDVEGAEMSVFQGAIHNLQNHSIEVIIFEVNPNIALYGHTPQELLALVSSFGYQIFAFNHHGKLIFINQDSRFPITTNLVAVSPNQVTKTRLKRFFE